MTMAVNIAIIKYALIILIIFKIILLGLAGTHPFLEKM